MNTLWKAAQAAAWGAVRMGGLHAFLTEKQGQEIQRICPGAQGVYIAAFPYYHGDVPGNLSLYCRGADYHLVLRHRLELVCKELRKQHPDYTFLSSADNSPLPERRIAQLAGLGEIGLHNLLILPDYGSYLFLGTILTDYLLEEVRGTGERLCHNCGLCRKACPTQALGEDGFDASRCLSLITQRKGELTPWEAEKVRENGMVWGCDRCQKACPHNHGVTHSQIAEFLPRHCSLGPADLAGATNRSYAHAFSHYAFAWRGPAPLKRNLALLEKEE